MEGELSPQKLQSKDRSLEFDTEVYPVGFVPELGVIVGLTQGVSYTVIADLPCFELRTKARSISCSLSFFLPLGLCLGSVLIPDPALCLSLSLCR